MRLRPLSPADTEGPSPHSFSPQIGRGERGGVGTENEEEEGENEFLRVRTRCFPYECQDLRRTEKDYTV